MSYVSRTVSSLRTLLFRDRARDEVNQELRFHVEARAAHLVSQGVESLEADRRARAELGGIANQPERQREAAGLRLLDETLADIRYGIRGLWRNKGFGAIAILSLALGIGATSAMFSIVYAVLLDIYPYADSQRTVNPIVHDPGQPDDWNWFVLNRAQYQQYKSVGSFEDVFGQVGMRQQLDDNDVQQPLSIMALTPNATSFNRVPAMLGRSLQASDGDFGDTPPDVVVLGYSFWQKQYFGDRNVIGRDLKAGSKLYRIVGVMPQRYTLGGTPDVYMPTSQYTFPEAYIVAFAKLKPGVTAKQASDEVDPMLHEFARQNPNMFPKQFHARLQPLLDGFTTRSKVLKNFPLLYLAVGALLIIGCANCSLLLMARGTTRVHEFALRSAVGASRLRIVRQLLVECLTISLLGSIFGVALAYVLARLPLQLAEDLFPSEAVIRMNLPVLAFSVSVAVLAGLFFGLLPAIKFSRPQLSQVLQANSRRTVAAGSRRPLQVMIGGQIALTLVLLTLSGAAITGFVNLLRLPLGYDPSNVIAVNIGYEKDSAKTWPERLARSAAIQAKIEQVPGVLSVSMADDIPPLGGGTQPFELIGGTSFQQTLARQTDVGSNYFATLKIPLLQGRSWNAAEAREGLPLAVVNSAFVRRFSPDRSILNRVIRLPSLDMQKPPEGITFAPAFTRPEVRVIGVSGDAVNDGLDKPVLPNIYVNNNVVLWGGTLLFVRTRGNPHDLERTIAHAIHDLSVKNFVGVFPYSLQEIVERDPSYRTQRLVAVLLAIFAGLALALSLVGLYSVVAYVVAQRTSEFGIRLALGAQRTQIVGLVLRSNIFVILGGITVGLLVSLALRSHFQHWSESSSRSPLILLAAAGLLLLAALLASLVPAHRASRVQPSQALRAE